MHFVPYWRARTTCLGNALSPKLLMNFFLLLMQVFLVWRKEATYTLRSEIIPFELLVVWHELARCLLTFQLLVCLTHRCNLTTHLSRCSSLWVQIWLFVWCCEIAWYFCPRKIVFIVYSRFSSPSWIEKIGAIGARWLFCVCFLVMRF